MDQNASEQEGRPSKQDLAEDRTDWALHRSQLASERTFSAWMRTGITAVVAGLGVARLLHELGRPELTRSLGVVFTIAGGISFAVEDRMEPVLAAFRDQVLYLKHNLNTQAIASLRPELGRIENDVDRLIEQMNAAIREADVFIRRLEST